MVVQWLYLEDSANHWKVRAVFDEDDVLEAPLFLVNLFWLFFRSRPFLTTNH